MVVDYTGKGFCWERYLHGNTYRFFHHELTEWAVHKSGFHERSSGGARGVNRGRFGRRCLCWQVMLLLVAALASFVGCSRQEPVKVGFVGTLTGKNGDLGVAGRDGATLAVEALNAQGGINGRPVRLIVKDDAQDPAVAVRVNGELVREGVAAVIGHTVSSMTKAGLAVFEKSGIVVVSPTSSTTDLAGRDDVFFRVMEPNSFFARHHAETARRLGIRRVSVIYDINNPAYTVDMSRIFRDDHLRSGGVIVREVSFDSTKAPVFSRLVKSLHIPAVDGVLVLASSVDTMQIAQQIRKASPVVPILSGACGLAQRDLLQMAGKSSEGIIFTLPVNSQSTAPAYVAFRDAYRTRFGTDPTFSSVMGYDAAQLLFAALKKEPDPRGLRDAIKSMSRFEGLQGPIELDPFGDPHRSLCVVRIRDGRDEVLGE